MQDLNVNPKLPFEDNSFDVITNVVCFCSELEPFMNLFPANFHQPEET